MRGTKSFGSTLPKPGMLREHIGIYQAVNTINAEGYPVNTPTLICNTRAFAVNAGNEEFRSADTMSSEIVVNFSIRYRKDVTVGQWIKFREKWYNIIFVDSYGFTKQYLGLKATLTEGIDG